MAGGSAIQMDVAFMEVSTLLWCWKMGVERVDLMAGGGSSGDIMEMGCLCRVD